MKLSKDFYQNFGDQCLSIQNSGIFMKFLKNFDQNYLQELDDHRIRCKDFDQNSHGHLSDQSDMN